MESSSLALYIHWPFCQSLCPYCDFNSYLGKDIDQNEWSKAYSKAILIKPNLTEAYNNKGIILQIQSRLGESIETYNRVLSIKPEYAEAYDNMGVALKNKGNLEEAINAHKKSILIK